MTSRTASPVHSNGASGELRSPNTDHHRESARDDERQTIRVSDRVVLPKQLCDELQAAVEKAALRTADSITELRLAVKRFTVALKDDGAQAETVLIALKSVMNSRMLPIPEKRDEQWSAEDLRQQISTWSIKEFFGE